MEPVETIEVNDVKVEIYQDEDPPNPRKEFDHLGKMVCFHRRYDLGDKHDFVRSEDFDGWIAMEKYLRDTRQAVIVLPLYLYDHSGITISAEPFSCHWDSEQVGFIYVDAATVEKEFGLLSKKARNKAEDYLLFEVEEYDQYLRGDVYGYRVLDKDGNEADSCWGCFGLDYCREEARAAAERIYNKSPLLPGLDEVKT